MLTLFDNYLKCQALNPQAQREGYKRIVLCSQVVDIKWTKAGVYMSELPAVRKNRKLSCILTKIKNMFMFLLYIKEEKLQPETMPQTQAQTYWTKSENNTDQTKNPKLQPLHLLVDSEYFSTFNTEHIFQSFWFMTFNIPLYTWARLCCQRQTRSPLQPLSRLMMGLFTPS